MDPDLILIGIQPKMLDPYPYQMNTDPKLWKKTAKKYVTPELTRYLTGLMPPPTPHTLSSLTISMNTDPKHW
jgi:hypothetical protein